MKTQSEGDVSKVKKRIQEDIYTLSSNSRGHLSSYPLPSLEHFTKKHKSYKVLPEYSVENSERLCFLINPNPMELVRLENFTITLLLGTKVRDADDNEVDVGWVNQKFFLIKDLVFDTMFEDIKVSLDNTLVWKDSMDGRRPIYEFANQLFSKSEPDDLPKLTNSMYYANDEFKNSHRQRWRNYSASTNENAKCVFTHDIHGVFPFSSTQVLRKYINSYT